MHREWQPYGYRYVNAYDPHPLPNGEREPVAFAVLSWFSPTETRSRSLSE